MFEDSHPGFVTRELVYILALLILILLYRPERFIEDDDGPAERLMKWVVLLFLSWFAALIIVFVVVFIWGFIRLILL
jgi:hypothetical protein